MANGDVRIEAVTVNHGTSMFVELLVRTLRRHERLAALRLTVLDNDSQDEHRPALEGYLREEGIPFVQTGATPARNVCKHGEALSRFVLDTPDCSHYLLLDSDIWFVEDDTIDTMRRELDGRPDCFAIQARIFGHYAERIIEGRDGRIDGRDLEGVVLSADIALPTDQVVSLQTLVPHRCSPVCALVRNTPLFRRVVQTFGMAPAFLYGSTQGRYYDTFALVTHVMEVFGRPYAISARTVHHFTETANRPEFRGARDRDAARMLQDLRQIRA